jgi:hypothetical protein
MHRQLIIVDDFYEDPDAVVRYARTLRYCTPYNEPGEEEQGQHVPWRASWFTPAHLCPFKSSHTLIAKLEFLTGERIDVNHWTRDFPIGNDGRPSPGYDSKPRTAWWNCCFHVKHLLDQEPGECVHNHNVYDPWNAVGGMGWAGLVYLNKDAPREAGLNLWRNRQGRPNDWYTPKEDWELIDRMANVYNRLILHRGYIPHSGARGWGSTFEDGRLFQTFFFSTLVSAETPAVSPHDLQLALPLLTRS